MDLFTRTIGSNFYIQSAVAVSAVVATGVALYYRRQRRQPSIGSGVSSGILKAARSGAVQVIQNLPADVDVDKERDEQRYTALALAVRYGHLECVSLLLSKGASVDAVDNFGFTPLHTAAHYNAPLPIVRCLLEKGAKLEQIANNSWTPLHMATASGHLEIVNLFIASGANINATTIVSQTPILMASCNGHVDVVRVLLEAGADTTIRTVQKLETPLYYAARNGHSEIVKMLASKDPTLMAMATVDGALPIHAATSKTNLEMIKLLLQYGADIKSRKKDGSTVLHIAATNSGENILEELLKLGAPLEGQDSFGSTPLHKATTKKQVAVAALLLKNGACVNSLDNDKMTPLHTLCSAPTDKIKGPLVDHALEIFEMLCDKGVELQCRDMSNSTPLHHAVCRPWNLPLVKRIVQKDPGLMFLTDKTDRTPLHLVSQMYQHQDIQEYLQECMKQEDPSFFSSYDPNKKVSLPVQKHANPNAHEVLKALEEDVSLKGIAKLISKGNVKNIVVLTGAGISTNAGIPDFRSPGGKGLYTNPSLSVSQDSFTPYAFKTDPQKFFSIAKDIFLPVFKGQHKPTVAHRFIALLHKKGLLQRNYTQNIDTLERRAGIPHEKLVEAHGSFNSATCMRCNFNLKTEDADSFFWKKIESGEVPMCPQCISERNESNPLKPDVVLFGEHLPARFHDLQQEDLENKCDLLIVMGTSLLVYPFAGLPNIVKPTVPRLLFNTNPVGPFTEGVQEKVNEGEFINIERGKPTSYRDIAVIGDIDKSLLLFLQLLGWTLDD